MKAISTTMAAAAAVLVFAATPAAAQVMRLYDGYSNDPTKVITYTRVNVSPAEAETAQGARALLQQIETAADAVCGGQVHAQVSPKDYAACRSDAVDGAVRKLGVPAVKAALAARRTEVRYAAN